MLPNNYSSLAIDIGNPNVAIPGSLTVGNGITVTGGSSQMGALSVTTLTSSAAVTLNSLTVVNGFTISGAAALTTLSVSGLSALTTVTAGATTASALTVTGALNLTSATTNNFVVKRFISTAITQADLVGGAATQTINLAPALPANVLPVAGYLITTVATTSSSGDTTDLTASIGIATDPDGYITVVSIFGASGTKQTAAGGAMLGSMRLADTPQIALTASGGAPDIGHINQLSVQAVIYYIESAALS